MKTQDEKRRYLLRAVEMINNLASAMGGSVGTNVKMSTHEIENIDSALKLHIHFDDERLAAYMDGPDGKERKGGETKRAGWSNGSLPGLQPGGSGFDSRPSQTGGFEGGNPPRNPPPQPPVLQEEARQMGLEKETLTRKEAAKMLGVHFNTLTRSDVPSIKIGGRVLYRVKSVENYMRKKEGESGKKRTARGQGVALPSSFHTALPER